MMLFHEYEAFVTWIMDIIKKPAVRKCEIRQGS